MAGSPKIVISNCHRFPKQPKLNHVNLGDDSSSCSLPHTKGTRVHTSSVCSNTSRKQSVCISPYFLHSQMTCLHLIRWAQRWMDKSLAFAKFCPGQGIPWKVSSDGKESAAMFEKPHCWVVEAPLHRRWLKAMQPVWSIAPEQWKQCYSCNLLVAWGQAPKPFQGFRSGDTDTASF